MELLWSMFWIFVAFLFYVFLQWRIKAREQLTDYNRISSYLPQIVLYPQPDNNNIYNISSRVQGQNQSQLPDGYLSVEHITITNEMNKPPKYDDAPPSYEEAIRIAMAHNNSMQTFNAEQGQSSEQPQSSTAITTATITTVVVPAVANRPTE